MKPEPADFDAAGFDGGEWAALYAAGALSPEECAQFEAKLAAGDAALLNELRALEPVVEGLLDQIEPVTPPPELRSRLLEQLDATPDSNPTAHQAPPARRQRDLYVQRASKGRWREFGVPGATRRILWLDRERNEYSALVRCEPGTVFPDHVHPGPEQCLVLEGDLWLDDVEYGPGDFQRFEGGTRHGVQTTRRGCLILLVGALEEGMV